MKKVFCYECKHSRIGDCWHKNNLVETPLCRDAINRNRGEINKNNDCEWFEKKKFYHEDIFWFVVGMVVIILIAGLVVSFTP